MDQENEIMLDRTQGCMVGGAVGDALGYPVEFAAWPQIQWKYGVSGIRSYQLDRRGLAPISDDTQMSLFTAAGILLGMTRKYMRGIMGRIDTYCQWSYLDWLHTQEWSSRHEEERIDSWLMDVPELYARRAPGNTCLSALRAIEKDKPVENDSCGCGGVMRTAPMALLSYIHDYSNGDPDYCDMCAAEAARITHKHPLGFLPSAVLNRILMRIMAGKAGDGEQLAAVVEDCVTALAGIKSQTDEDKTYGECWPNHVAKLQSIIRKALELAYSDKPDVVAIESLGGGWTGHEALAIAIYSAVKHRHSFEDAIISAVNHSGDSDSTGAICGNIIGCLLGRQAIPSKFTDKLELVDVIEEMAHDLWTGCIISEYDRRETEEKKLWYWKYCKHRREPQPERRR
ncbi:MAG: ADP-ribosylglycohydrolase family protein [Bacteroidales bacterium]|nr:ADP-ribosylglycohydrolase family protein [Bacteroidales bacterium]